MKKTVRILSLVMAVIMMITALNITSFAAVSTLARPVVTATVTSTTNPTIKLTWAKVDGATKYYVYRRDTASGSLSLYKKTSNLYFKDTEVTKDKTYYYKVKAVTIKNSKVTNSSATSKTVNATVSALVAPKVTAKALSASQIKISWAKVAGATRYYMYRSTDGKTYESIGYTTKLTYTMSNLNMSTKYYFKVKSANVVSGKVKKSSYSAVATAKTQAKAGQVMVDFKAISNKEAGLPTGSAIVCLTMLLNHYGVDCTAKEVMKYFDCSTDFYTENGEKYGPYTAYYFVGDPTSNKAYGYGTELTEIYIARKSLLEAKDINNIVSASTSVVGMESSKSIKRFLDAGNIILVRIRTSIEENSIKWWAKYKGGDTLVMMNQNDKYAIICGYTKNGYICYDPASNKYEEYNATPNGYNLLADFMPLVKK